MAKGRNPIVMDRACVAAMARQEFLIVRGRVVETPTLRVSDGCDLTDITVADGEPLFRVRVVADEPFDYANWCGDGVEEWLDPWWVVEPVVPDSRLASYQGYYLSACSRSDHGTVSDPEYTVIEEVS